MPKVITTLQAMSHPTVVATINCLSEMTQRLQDENDELKAALAQPEEQQSCDKQAPVTWGVDWGKDGDIPCVSIIKRLPDGGMEVVAVEYGPPQRPWVELTKEEIDSALSKYQNWYEFAQHLENILKEKNAWLKKTH